MVGADVITRRRLEIGFALDRRWHELRGEMTADKRTSLLALARVMDESGVPWAIIGGVALQIRQDEPRTTLDIDVALLDRSQIPRARLEGAGFRRTGSFEHSENWEGPDSTPLQFADDDWMSSAVIEAEPVPFEGVALRVATSLGLLRLKLRAGGDPARRRSKRLRYMADALALVEQDPSLVEHLDPGELALLQSFG